MNEERRSNAQGASSHHHHHSCKYHSSRPAPAGDGVTAKLRWGWNWFWHLVFRNRVAIFIASLFWLLYRSGTQPRRLAYPCQQVAAVNVGAFLAALIPTALLLRRNKGGVPLPKRVVIRRQVIAVAILCVVGVIGIETYQYADDLLQPAADPPNIPPPAVEPDPALVGIAHRPYPNWHPEIPAPAPTPFTAAEIDGLVERAIILAGGLDQIMSDKDANGEILVTLKPNLVNNTDVVTNPENGVVTDYRVMQSVVRLVKEAGARTGIPTRVVIAEGSAGPADWNNGIKDRDITKHAFIDTGYTNDPETGRQWFKYDSTVELIDLNDTGGIDQHDPSKVTQVTVNNAVMRRHYWLPNILLQSDVFISVPTLKNHGNADATISLKNCGIGCAPSDIYHNVDTYANHGQQMKRALHFDNMGFGWDIDRGSGLDYPAQTSDENYIVNYTIVDINLARPIDFAVVDGLVGITNGPTGTNRISPRMQLVMAGTDPVAVDSLGVLLMGYDPEYILYLRWAYNRGLGTMKREMITVAGDHPALWRQYFGAYGPAVWPTVPCETSPPTLFGISVGEGQDITKGDPVTVNGFMDDRGVVRAELAVATLGNNLVQNGDFENGNNGWTTWRAPWGSNEVYDFNNANVSQMGGQKCLRLGGGSTNSSFGVYQEVTVEPGKTYRVDCEWKGTRRGDSNWWEVILVDGAYNYDQADNGPIVEKNYMFAYDSVTYGFPGSIGQTFGWIWTHNQYAPPKRQVDWNHRLGRRTASGTTMTVILKAGSVSPGGVEAFFDNVTLREVSEDYVIDAKANPTAGVELIADLTRLPIGEYPGELRVTVYDAAMNEDSIYRNVQLHPIPMNPWVSVNPETLSQELFVANTPHDDTFEVWNAGGAGGDLNYTITDDQTWIHVNPPDGVSPQNPPATNLHTVTYDHLPPGVHTGTITVQGSHNTKTILVTITVNTVKPDFDDDGDVDSTDFGLFQRCYSGTSPVTPACQDRDLGNPPDTFVNSADLVVFLNCISGPEAYAAEGCDQ